MTRYWLLFLNLGNLWSQSFLTLNLGPYQWQAFKVRFKVFTVVLTVLKSRSTSHCLTFIWVWSLSKPSKVALCCMLSHFSRVWLCATLWTICSPPGSSVHGVLQARILVWVAMPGSRGSSQLRDQTHVSYISCIGRWVFTTSTTWKAHGGSGFTYKSSPVLELLPWTTIRSLTKVVYYLGEGNGTPLQYPCLENPMDGGAWWAAVHGVTKSQTWLKRLHFHFLLSCIGEGNGNPLQCSCLENPRDGGAWWASVYGVAQSQTRLKRLSSSSSSSSILSAHSI